MPEPRFLFIPVELRNMIYKLVFEGSTVEFNHTNDGEPRPFEIAGHVDIIFTCKRCYDEGREALWRNVIVYGHDEDATLHDLSKHLGDFERSCIGEIREVKGDGRNNSGVTKLGLASFPRLKRYQFFAQNLCIVQQPQYVLYQADQQAWIQWALSVQRPNSNPNELLQAEWGIDVKKLEVELGE
ncbi:hypothetical protein F5Y09DRAFT_339173 [Xylaria sp. FL1042]|nr:hypothetical protein F5Y09DRAFT_339173 [Xylaria sp. FL1042]